MIMLLVEKIDHGIMFWLSGEGGGLILPVCVRSRRVSHANGSRFSFKLNLASWLPLQNVCLWRDNISHALAYRSDYSSC